MRRGIRAILVASTIFTATLFGSAAEESHNANVSAAFAPTIPNKAAAPRSAPEGMVWIPGGEFSMGAAVGGEGSHAMPMASNDSQPVHRVYVDGLWMDATPVTNAQFEKFVKATKYVTIAERTPTKEEFPTAPEENLVAGAVVFAPTAHEGPLNNHYQW